MLKRVSIQNFKSLKDVTLDLQKVNLLIGPNNSGKTNFLKALEGHSISTSISQSVDNLKVDDLKAISFRHQPVNISYEFRYSPDLEGYLSSSYKNQRNVIYNYSDKNEVINDANTGYVNRTLDDWFSDENGIRADIEVVGGHRREFSEFKRTKIFRPDPTKLIQYAKFSAEDVDLAADCSNLISFYYYVESNFKKKSNRIQNDLSKCIPEIAYFTLPPVKVGNESLLGLRFFDKDEEGFWAEEVSEGVLYFLSLLCIINQPNPPKLLLLEEPEKGIHPRRIREVMDFIFRLADEKDIQIILTTHNEHVLDDFATRPESVFVFDKDEEGATYVRNLQTDIIEPTNKRNRELGLDEVDLTTNLSENWLYGLLGGVPAIS